MYDALSELDEQEIGEALTEKKMKKFIKGIPVLHQMTKLNLNVLQIAEILEDSDYVIEFEALLV